MHKNVEDYPMILNAESNAQSLINTHLIRENPFTNKTLSKITTEDMDAFYNLKIDEA